MTDFWAETLRDVIVGFSSVFLGSLLAVRIALFQAALSDKAQRAASHALFLARMRVAVSENLRILDGIIANSDELATSVLDVSFWSDPYRSNWRAPISIHRMYARCTAMNELLEALRWGHFELKSPEFRELLRELAISARSVSRDVAVALDVSDAQD